IVAIEAKPTRKDTVFRSRRQTDWRRSAGPARAERPSPGRPEKGPRAERSDATSSLGGSFRFLLCRVYVAYTPNSWVIEDDYVSEFRYEGHPLEALQSLDRDGRVVYVGTFSKTLFPALRVAYLVLPRSLVPAFVAAKWATDRFSATLPQEALTDFITTGQFERYLRRAVNRNAARRHALID